MFNKRKLYSKIFVFGLGVSLLAPTSIFARCGDHKQTPTDKLVIFEQDDEKEVYNDHGITRGDLSYLNDVKFNADKVENISGDVFKVMRVQFPDQDCYLIAVVMTKANNGKVSINLGPIWFLEENGFQLFEGDSIQVTGAKMRTNGQNVVIATELSSNGKSINIRDKAGTALWGSPKAQKGNADCMKMKK